MTKLLIAVAATGLFMGAAAAPIYYVATLSGANESPPNISPATGFATVVFDSVAHTLFISTDFQGLTGTSTVAHIHCCVGIPLDTTLNAAAATPTPTFPGFPTGVTAGSYNHLLDLTLTSSYRSGFVTASGGTAAGAEAVLGEGLRQGRAYFNIHSATYPGGEIRGFLVTPEPGTFALVGGVLAASLYFRRRRTGLTIKSR
jgi:hypothetical protein